MGSRILGKRGKGGGEEEGKGKVRGEGRGTNID